MVPLQDHPQTPGFGFTGLLAPFSPERPEDVAHLEQMQSDIHAHFIALVEERRGDRLSTEADLFSGLFCRVDSRSTSASSTASAPSMTIRQVEPARRPLLRRLFFGVGEAAAAGTLAVLEERPQWTRYRL